MASSRCGRYWPFSDLGPEVRVESAKRGISKVKTPTLILSALGGIEDKVKAFGVGADDYMTKPFHREELVARIHAIVRRSKGHAHSVIQTTTS
jgi:DNA-binding response OmpR family regulator